MGYHVKSVSSSEEPSQLHCRSTDVEGCNNYIKWNIVDNLIESLDISSRLVSFTCHPCLGYHGADADAEVVGLRHAPPPHSGDVPRGGSAGSSQPQELSSIHLP